MDKVGERTESEPTQDMWTPRTLDKVLEVCEQHETRVKEKTAHNDTKLCDIPKFDLGSTDLKQKSKNTNVNVDQCNIHESDRKNGLELEEARKRPKRETNFSSFMCSPYVQQVVQLVQSITKQENDVCDFTFAAYGEKCVTRILFLAHRKD